MKKLLIILFVCVSCLSSGQHLFNTSQVYLNRNVLNPAFVGADNFFSSSVWYRNQWAGIKGAPETFHVQINGPLMNEKAGIGLVYTNDRVGVSTRNTVMAQYSYRVKLKEGQWLRGGISGGFMQWAQNWTKIQTNDPDASFANDIDRIWSPELYMGFGYETKKVEAGIAAPLLYTTSIAGSGGIGSSYQHYLVYGKYNVEMRQGWTMDPLVVVKYMKASGAQMDLNVRFTAPQEFFFGAGYRTGESVGLFFGTRFADNWQFAYQYDILTRLYKYASGSHELGLKYNFRYKIRAQDPRMF